MNSANHQRYTFVIEISINLGMLALIVFIFGIVFGYMIGMASSKE